MMDKFRVGQLVRVIKCKEPHHQYLIGTVCTIISKSFPDYRDSSYKRYETDVMVGDRQLQPAEHCLEAVYDGDEKSSWSECAWKPKELQHDKG
jgi:hypothetical protein